MTEELYPVNRHESNVNVHKGHYDWLWNFKGMQFIARTLTMKNSNEWIGKTMNLICNPQEGDLDPLTEDQMKNLFGWTNFEKTNLWYQTEEANDSIFVYLAQEALRLISDAAFKYSDKNQLEQLQEGVYEELLLDIIRNFDNVLERVSEKIYHKLPKGAQVTDWGSMETDELVSECIWRYKFDNEE